MKAPSVGPRAVLAGVAGFYAVGLAGHLIAGTRSLMLGATPWFLLAAGAAVLLAAVRGTSVPSWLLWLVPMYGVAFALEAVGVATGLVFGRYHYSTVLGSLVLGVPPVIGWNWVLVVLGAHMAVRRLLPGMPELLTVLVVGLACVGFDLLLEPVAAGLGYWVWDTGAVPLQNYAAWGLIAAAGSWWAGRLRNLPAAPVLGWYALVQAVFFAVLGAAGVRA